MIKLGCEECVHGHKGIDESPCNYCNIKNSCFEKITPKGENKMTIKLCWNCEHEKCNWRTEPCISCDSFRRENFVPKCKACDIKFDDSGSDKSKEPDYSFNADIQNALKNGISVWCRYENGIAWGEITKSNCTVGLILSKCVWSLTKPKVKVKKTISRWINIYGKTVGTYPHHSKEEANSGSFKDRTDCVELKGEYWVEE